MNEPQSPDSSPDEAPLPPAPALLQGKKVLFVGKLAAMNTREVEKFVQDYGAELATKDDAEIDLIIVGELDWPLLEENALDELLHPEVQAAIHREESEVLPEPQFWQRVELVDETPHIRRLYTPAMLADLLDLPVNVIRRWHRRGLLKPVKVIRKLPYFDFQEVTTARRLAELMAAGASPQAIEQHLQSLKKLLPDIERPLAQLSILVEGKQVLLRQGDGLLESGGQLRFDFDSETENIDESPEGSFTSTPGTSPQLPSAEEWRQRAQELEEAEQLPEATACYRAALVASRGQDADLHFALAESLYRQNDLPAARERYFMAVELDDEFVEARANLGCVLAEMGQIEQALAAFEGALSLHPDYPDAHYHLANLYDDQQQLSPAVEHWKKFLELSPESPWAEEIQNRLQEVAESSENSISE
ncbi:O-linked GlcNAc transferase [Planctomycetales bacterium 10988]|nr:O-linked GlcNAc transferase [Planctomycetales bacterium 10988]